VVGVAGKLRACRPAHANFIRGFFIPVKGTKMRHTIFNFWLVFLLLIAPLPTLAQEADDPTAVAQALVDNLIKGDFEAATADFDATMLSMLPADALEKTWNDIITQVGAFQEQLGTTTQEVEGYTLVVITLQFEKLALDVQISIDQAGQVGGLYFSPAQTADAPAWEPPDYADQNAFTEQDVTLNAGTEWELPGNLTLPNGDGPFPAVVLVHGSGPNDRDESYGPNKTFRDLAWGLASKGIAVLRYDKRTRVYGQAMAGQPNLTVKEETMDDALAAIDLLAGTEIIDPALIFMLGHSLGGYLAPRIAAQTDKLAGVIILAGPTRPLEVLTLEQVDYLLSLDGGELSEEDQAQLDALVADAEALKILDESSDPSTTYMGIPAPYWLDLKNYDPVATAQELDLPLLILQGERDYQVTMVDFEGWKTGLEARDNVTFISYPALNHLFLSGEGPKSTPDEYNVPGHVPQEVITDIVSWIQH
jgi:dienelactone hydrolase